MPTISPIVCTAEELTLAYTALSELRTGARKVRIVVDGDVTEWAQVSLSQLSDHVAAMQAYQNSVSGSATTAFSISGSKGF